MCPVHSFIPRSNDRSLTAILVSRFLIDLQAANRRTVRFSWGDNMFPSGLTSDDSENQSTSTLSFARFDVVGSLAFRLEPGEHASFGISTKDGDREEMGHIRDEDGVEMSPIDPEAVA